MVKKIRIHKLRSLIIKMFFLFIVLIIPLAYLFMFKQKKLLTYEELVKKMNVLKSECNIAIIDDGINVKYGSECDNCVNLTEDKTMESVSNHGNLMYELIHDSNYGISKNSSISVIKIIPNAAVRNEFLIFSTPIPISCNLFVFHFFLFFSDCYAHLISLLRQFLKFVDNYLVISSSILPPPVLK